MTDQMKDYFSESFTDGRKVLTAYHTDFGGIPSQACVNKIAEGLDFHGLHPAYITFESTKYFKRRLNEENFDEIMFLDFEPHPDISDSFDCVEKVSVFGHHPVSGYMKELEKDDKVTYFNPKRILPKNVKYHKFTGGGKQKQMVYRRGVPIFFPISLAAEKLDIDTSFATSLGLRGYGFTEVAKHYEQKRNMDVDSKIARSMTRAISLLFSYRLNYSKDVVKKISKIDNYNNNDVENGTRYFTHECYSKNIYNSADKLCSEAISDFESFGNDIILFPIKKPMFDQIKGVVGEIEIRKRARNNWPVRIYADMTDKKKRKFSIRSHKSIDVLGLLGRAYSQTDVEEHNYGGHTSSSGFTCQTSDAGKILKSFVNEYYCGDIDEDVLDEKVSVVNGISKNQTLLF